MTPEEDVLAATLRFYQALEELFVTGNTEPMKNAWHNTPRVSSSHPFGPWSYGWDEVWATWVECSNLANPESAGTYVRDLKVQVYGDVAYVTGIFVSSPAFNNATMNITNILHKADGAWKIVHHHADKTPSLEAKIVELAEAR